LEPAKAEPPAPDSDRFISLSAELTGFGEMELLETGVGDIYLAFLLRVFPDVTPNLLAAWQQVEEELPPEEREEGLGEKILDDPHLGPFARNVMQLWYTGNWSPMSAAWSNAYGNHHDQTESSLLAAGYPHGLMWQAAIGAHPQAARPTGFAGWAEPPKGN
jgi:hypothetical protein